MKKLSRTILLAAILQRISNMYIDPNTGGMLFQILAVLFGLLSGFLVFFSSRIRMTIARFRRYLRERRGADPEPQESGEVLP